MALTMYWVVALFYQVVVFGLVISNSKLGTPIPPEVLRARLWPPIVVGVFFELFFVALRS